MEITSPKFVNRDRKKSQCAALSISSLGRIDVEVYKNKLAVSFIQGSHIEGLGQMLIQVCTSVLCRGLEFRTMSRAWLCSVSRT